MYHTNVMMAVGTGVAIVCADSVRDPKERQHLLVGGRRWGGAMRGSAVEETQPLSRSGGWIGFGCRWCRHARLLQVGYPRSAYSAGRQSTPFKPVAPILLNLLLSRHPCLDRLPISVLQVLPTLAFCSSSTRPGTPSCASHLVPPCCPSPSLPPLPARQSSLRRTHEVVEISLAQMDALCGNALELQDGRGLPVMAMSTQVGAGAGPRGGRGQSASMHAIGAFRHATHLLRFLLPSLRAIPPQSGCGYLVSWSTRRLLPVSHPSAQAYNAFTEDQRRAIRRHCADIVHAPIDTLERVGGGGVRCTLAELF